MPGDDGGQHGQYQHSPHAHPGEARADQFGNVQPQRHRGNAEEYKEGRNDQPSYIHIFESALYSHVSRPLVNGLTRHEQAKVHVRIIGSQDASDSPIGNDGYACTDTAQLGQFT